MIKINLSSSSYKKSFTNVDNATKNNSNNNKSNSYYFSDIKSVVNLVLFDVST